MDWKHELCFIVVIVLGCGLLTAMVIGAAQDLHEPNWNVNGHVYVLLPPDEKHTPKWVGDTRFGSWICPADAKYMFQQTGIVPEYGTGYLSKWPMEEHTFYFGYGPKAIKPICLY
jgi:hypothetical protein